MFFHKTEKWICHLKPDIKVIWLSLLIIVLEDGE